MKNSRSTETPAIFVHAGAGFHSTANEHVHLQACNDACQAAMQILLGGGSAVDAVEMAIKILEDREITNAGYGSNLSMDGVVECDALVVDHLGRSGGVGAIAQVKNPISVARKVLDHSDKQLTLRRVPPNLLVGQGASDFAYDNGIPILPYDVLVSPAARERWLRWRYDLKAVERKHQKHGDKQKELSSKEFHAMINAIPEPLAQVSKVNSEREKHTRRLEKRSPLSQSISSTPSTASKASLSTRYSSSPASALSQDRASDMSMISDSDDEPQPRRGSIHESSTNALINSSQSIPTLLTLSKTDVLETTAPSIEHDSDQMDIDTDELFWTMRRSKATRDGSHDDINDNDQDEGSGNSRSSSSTLQLPSLSPSPPPNTPSGYDALLHAANVPIPPTPSDRGPSPMYSTPLNRVKESSPLPPAPNFADLLSNDGTEKHPDEDWITDTVGAIAVDRFGRMACGASSGGIGMKYRGRVGPAALVGVGGAVVPVHPEDSNKTCVSAVTSGTGEHMGTTLAASLCAERLYTGMRKRQDGGLEEAQDDEVLNTFIQRDFMAHPSVKNSHSVGAIGVLSVKKDKDGMYLYFAHNTDSFALASMGADDAVPQCTMSRSSGNGSIAQGGRSIRLPRRKKARGD
ncbi:hypothetical protein FKW77_005890 [Venturia effusa]|uniref:N-terminal nucleophile aminohydrolase n=1 Tax=Venturia effusa TaxID=50376 RepID=A0A517LFJ6_9PEZI|nr:hypothetical protein FKW77_005890 [Venturia effusa]